MPVLLKKRRFTQKLWSRQGILSFWQTAGRKEFRAKKRQDTDVNQTGKKCNPQDRLAWVSEWLWSPLDAAVWRQGQKEAMVCAMCCRSLATRGFWAPIVELAKIAGFAHLSSTVNCKTLIWGWAWWHMPVILVLRRQRQDLQVHLGYTVRLYLTKTITNKQQQDTLLLFF